MASTLTLFGQVSFENKKRLLILFKDVVFSKYKYPK